MPVNAVCLGDQIEQRQIVNCYNLIRGPIVPGGTGRRGRPPGVLIALRKAPVAPDIEISVWHSLNVIPAPLSCTTSSAAAELSAGNVTVTCAGIGIPCVRDQLGDSGNRALIHLDTERVDDPAMEG